MSYRAFLLPAAVAAGLLLGGCNDNNSGAPTGAPVVVQPTPPSAMRSISEFAASLIAMVSGGACDTALPSDVNTASLTADEAAQDANALQPRCS